MRPSPIIPSCIPTACHVSVGRVSPSSREVSLHGVDLDIGIELTDLDPRDVRLEVAGLEQHVAPAGIF
jgi:hypothetical protein